MSSNSQKFIARNRAPRVQIEYDVELYGSEKKVQLPFVMGVMSDLAGKSEVPQPAIEDRKFLEIDTDNFDERMKAMAPRAVFTVPNTLTGQGSLPIDLTFEKMADFTPAAIASKVDALRPLLEARTQLTNLMAYMDGKAGAEALIEKILANPSLLAALSGAGAAGADHAAALDSLRALTPQDAAPEDNSADVLDALRAAAPDDTPTADSSADVLDALKADPPEDTPPEDNSAGVLDALKADPPDDTPPEDSAADVLDALKADPPEDTPPEDYSAGVLDALRTDAPDDTPPEDNSAGVLDALKAEAPDDTPPEDGRTEVLDALRTDAPEDTPPEDRSAGVLDALRDDAPPNPQEEPDDTGAALDSLAALDLAETADDPTDDPTDNLLADLAASAPEQAAATDDTAAALDSLAALELPETAEGDASDLGDLLSDLGDDPDTPEPAAGDDLDDLLGDLGGDDPDTPEPAAAGDDLDDLLGDLGGDDPDTPEPAAAGDDLDDLLGDLGGDDPDTPEPAAGDDLDDLLGDLGGDDPDTPEPAAGDDLDDLLGDLGGDDPDTPEPTAAGDDLDDLLGDLGGDDPDTPEPAAGDDLDNLLGDLGGDDPDTPEPAAGDDLDNLLGDLGGDDPDTPEPAAAGDDLDNLLGDLGGDDPDTPEPAAGDDLDDLLGDLGGDDPDTPEPAAGDDLDDLLGDLTSDDGDGDLDDLLGDLGDEAAAPAEAATGDSELDALLGDLGGDDAEIPEPAAGAAAAQMMGRPEFAYGTISADRPAPERLNRKRFRLAILGDFSGRAARGVIETGDALAARRATLLDPDTVEQVIESFATELVLPIGRDGAGVAVQLGGLDDLHPDELYENLPIFAELNGLCGQLAAGATAENAAQRLRDWGAKYATPVAPPRAASGGNTVRADLKLSDFQRLIGATAPKPPDPSALDDLLARIVGPHVRALPDPGAAAMKAAVDQALSAAMRLLLHHPEFQSLEAQWRSLDLIARSIETDDTLDVMLYDISAEEIAADLAAADDLSQSGLVRLLTEEPLDPENGRGGYSALIGLYTFEETPPHAELLGRIGRVAAHVDAPFLAAITPAFLDIDKKDRHPLVAKAWDTLRAMPEAGHLGLMSPRFLLRRPYGAKSEPIYEFEFEEFTMAEGLSGMLWANPVVLAAILLAKSFRKNGPSMGLGSVMSLGEMPYHYVTDRHGDQVALPCTERNLTESRVAAALARGIMPVVSIKGRDEVRLASFRSLAGEELLGPWTGVAPPEPSPPRPAPVTDDDGGDDDGGADPGGDDDLDALLAGFGDDTDAGTDDDLGDLGDLGDLEDLGEIGDIDADLAALLDDL